jgi:hypothetical protein
VYVQNKLLYEWNTLYKKLYENAHTKQVLVLVVQLPLVLCAVSPSKVVFLFMQIYELLRD